MEGRNPSLMSPEEIVREIADHKKSLERTVSRLSELSRGLHDRMRRNSGDEDASVYIAFSNVWVRFSGMISQGLSRTASGDRFLRMIPTQAEREELEREQQRKRARAEHRRQRRAQAAPSRSPVEDLMEMYGSEEVINAER